MNRGNPSPLASCRPVSWLSISAIGTCSSLENTERNTSASSSRQTRQTSIGADRKLLQAFSKLQLLQIFLFNFHNEKTQAHRSSSKNFVFVYLSIGRQLSIF
uniref:(northern house mosquito) hypothetical protein n=1 Tax=Culex pipiens TaxID=7175 RepID=A0A8D8DWI2_CULPI